MTTVSKREEIELLLEEENRHGGTYLAKWTFACLDDLNGDELRRTLQVFYSVNGGEPRCLEVAAYQIKNHFCQSLDQPMSHWALRWVDASATLPHASLPNPIPVDVQWQLAKKLIEEGFCDRIMTFPTGLGSQRTFGVGGQDLAMVHPNAEQVNSSLSSSHDWSGFYLPSEASPLIHQGVLEFIPFVQKEWFREEWGEVLFENQQLVHLLSELSHTTLEEGLKFLTRQKKNHKLTRSEWTLAFDIYRGVPFLQAIAVFIRTQGWKG